MQRSTLGLIGAAPVVLFLSYNFMYSASQRDWSATGQGYFLLFAALPGLAFLLLRTGKHFAHDHRLLAGLVGLFSIALAVVASLTIHVEYYEQTMIPVLAITYVFTFATVSSYAFAIIEKRSGRWMASKLLFFTIYLGYFLSLPGLYSSYQGGAVLFLTLVSCGIAVIIDLVFEMRVRYGRGIVKSLAEITIAVILVVLMAVPILYTMVMAL